jgi:hypothetical protein
MTTASITRPDVAADDHDPVTETVTTRNGRPFLTIATDCGVARSRPVQATPDQRPPTRIYANARTVVTLDGLYVGEIADVDDYGVFYPRQARIDLADKGLSTEDRLFACSGVDWALLDEQAARIEKRAAYRASRRARAARRTLGAVS